MIIDFCVEKSVELVKNSHKTAVKKGWDFNVGIEVGDFLGLMFVCNSELYSGFILRNPLYSV